MQMYKSPFTSVWSCIRTVYATEGVRAFYRSYVTQLTMNVPFQSLHFMVYESMQGVTNPGRNYNPKAHMLSGGMAGAVAAAVTTPLDVCKTLLNTQEATALNSLGQPHISGLSQAFRTVYRLGGVRGYFQVTKLVLLLLSYHTHTEHHLFIFVRVRLPVYCIKSPLLLFVGQSMNF